MGDERKGKGRGRERAREVESAHLETIERAQADMHMLLL